MDGRKKRENIRQPARDSGPQPIDIQDAVKRKMPEEMLRESQKRFQALVETTSDFIWEVDADGNYTYCSPQIKQISGYTAEDTLGKTPFDRMPSEDRERALQMFKSFKESPQLINRMEITSLNRSGKPIILEVSGVPFFDDRRKLLGYRGISRDITEKKQAEQSLKESEEKYREILETMDDS